MPTPVPGAAGVVISFSGLGESEACWTRRFIRGIGSWSLLPFPGNDWLTLETGASHAPTFSKKTTHLLCPSRQGPKAEKALEWGIPVVDMIWLDGLLMTTSNSPMTKDGVNPMPSRSEDGGGGVMEPGQAPESVLQCAFFSSPFFL